MVVSLHKYLKSLLTCEFVGSLDELIDLFVEGKVPYGSWWHHVNQYAELQDFVYFVHYEDLIVVERKLSLFCFFLC